MVNVAILGFGVVGSGVAEVLDTNERHIEGKVDDLIRLKYILDVRDFPDSPFAGKVVHDFSVIEQDPEVSIVVETIGGAKVALDFTRRALQAGKSVITSNKELVAEHGCELLRLAQEKGVSYLFEASVGGGIPIIRPLNQCLAANEIEEITGILNGTTNYILTRMIRAGLSFDDALREAQANGYAEQDPTADIEGHDACRKICILASLAFGRHIYPRQVPTEGITGVTLADVAYADSCGKKLKLLGRAIRRTDGKVCAYVAPHLVDRENPLSGVEDVFNAIAVRGNAIGDVMFYGRGAGKLPTASAVVADVIDAAKHRDEKKRMFWAEGGDDTAVPPDGLESRWYLRGTGVQAAEAAFPDSTRLSRPGAPADEFALVTTGVTLADVAYADSCGKKLKLLGRAIRRTDGKVCAYVAPHLVDRENPLSGVEDVFNAIAVRGNAIGDVMFYGRGAGKLPTASAVVADVIDAAKHRDEKKRMFWAEGGDDTAVPPDGLESRWYLRGTGVQAAEAAFPDSTRLSRPGAPADEFALVTPPMTRAALEARLTGMTPGSMFRVLD